MEQISNYSCKSNGTSIYELLSATFQGVKRLFVLAYDATDDDDDDDDDNDAGKKRQ